MSCGTNKQLKFKKMKKKKCTANVHVLLMFVPHFDNTVLSITEHTLSKMGFVLYNNRDIT